VGDVCNGSPAWAEARRVWAQSMGREAVLGGDGDGGGGDGDVNADGNCDSGCGERENSGEN
jgi:hypothetical protein